MQKDEISATWIVDDDKVTTFILHRLLTLDNHFGQITILSDARVALENIQKCRDSPELLPELILLDINMPVMDGWEFVTELESLDFACNTHVFLLTSSINAADALKAERIQRLSGFFTKPITGEKLKHIQKVVVSGLEDC